MAEEAGQPGTPKPSEGKGRLRDMWQLPVLALSLAALGGAVAVAVMTAPEKDRTLDLAAAARQVEEGEFGAALDTLNKVVLPQITQGKLQREQIAEFHLLRARALYQGQREAGIDRAENHDNITREYAAAESYGATLAADDHYYLAVTNLALGRMDEATALVEKLPKEDAGRRLDLLKTMVDRSLASRPAQHGRALDLISRITADPGLSVEDRVWALTRQGELLIATGFPGDAVTKIVRTLPRLDKAEGPQLGELLVTLGKAYVAEANRSEEAEEAADRMHEARKQLSRASELVGPDHPLQWLVTLLLAEIDHHDGDLESARRRYAEVVEHYSFADGRPAALLGLAEVEAQINNIEARGTPEDALQHYEEVVGLFASSEFTALDRERVGGSLIRRFKEQYEKGAYPAALRFAGLAERLYNEDEAPAELLLALAEVHKRLAEDLLRSAKSGGLMSLAEADATTQREARTHLLQAGDYYKRHGTRVVLTNAAEYGESLWDAADAFDRAGDLEASIASFGQFVGDFPQDTRRPEAMFRLAEAYLARGDLELAEKLYQDLIDSRSSLQGAGEYADLSYVPLARSMFLDGDAANDSRAEALLMQVVGGQVAGPGTPVYRAALRELGDQMHRTGRYAGAIERFEQYLALSAQAGGAAEDLGVMYRLAEASRQSAGEIERALRGGMPEGTKRELELSRRERLAHSGDLYGEVRRQLDAKDSRTTLDDLYLRNAYFYEADAAFDLGDYATAIRRYDAARERYGREPVALIAMTQIVSALLAQGETAKAAVAQDRAKRFYESLPESVWDDPALPISRGGWERWLDAQAALSRTARAGSGAEAGGP